MDAIRLAQPRTVTGDAEGLVSRGGLVWLAETADLTGLTAGDERHVRHVGVAVPAAGSHHGPDGVGPR